MLVANASVMDIYRYRTETAGLGHRVKAVFVEILVQLRSGGTLPADDVEHLANVAGCTKAFWRNHAWPALADKFAVDEYGRLCRPDIKRAPIQLVDTSDTDDDDAEAEAAKAQRRREKAINAANARHHGNTHGKAKPPTEKDNTPAPLAVPPAATEGEDGGNHAREHAQGDARSMLGSAQNAAKSMLGASVLKNSEQDLAGQAASPARAGNPPPPLTSFLTSQGNLQNLEGRGGDQSPRVLGDAQDAQASAQASPEQLATAAPIEQPTRGPRLVKKPAQGAPAATEAGQKTLLPDDWQPSPETRALVEGWLNAEIVEEQLERFILRMQDEARLSAKWDAAFKSWCKRQVDWRRKHPQIEAPIVIRGGKGREPAQAAEAPPDPAETAPGPEGQHARVRKALKAGLGADYSAWMRDMKLVDLQGDKVILSLPGKIVAAHVAANYADKVLVCWRREVPEIRRVDFVPEGARAASG